MSAALVVNPAVRVAVERDGSQARRVHVVAPVRGEGLRVTALDADDVLVGVTHDLLRTAKANVRQAAGASLKRLRELGVLVAPDKAPRLLSFHCGLRDRASMPEALRDDLVVNPSFHLQRGTDALPAAIRRRVHLDKHPFWGPPEQWFVPPPRAWVEDPATRIVVAYGLSEADAVRLTRFVPGHPPPPPQSLDAELVALLRGVGILVSPTELDRQRVRWHAALAAAASSFRTAGHARLVGLLPAGQLHALQAFYADVIADGYARFSPGGTIKGFGGPCFEIFNEAVARFFHHQLADLVSIVVGIATKPSYAFSRQYLPGASLPRHVDEADASMFSISWLVDAQPLFGGASTWPLWLEEPSGQVAVHQAPGDGALYEGTRTPHHRDVLTGDRTSTSIFFEFVRRDFTGPLH